MRIKLNEHREVEVTAKAAEGGLGVVVAHRLDAQTRNTVTCTCWDSSGNSHSVSKECPDGGSPICDCTNPASPSITC